MFGTGRCTAANVNQERMKVMSKKSLLKRMNTARYWG
jgi:hypothetical protein